MASQVRDSLLRERLMATLSGFFGGLAALIATIGLYGVMSYTVTRRRNEIGIRMALGADRRDVMTMVMREAVTLLAAGVRRRHRCGARRGALREDAAVRTAAARSSDARDGCGGAGSRGAAASYVPALRASRASSRRSALRED